MKKFFKSLFWVLVCLALVFLSIRFGPSLYYRIFGSGNTQWISQRFSEELKEKNELVVFETTLTGQETVSKTAWLIGDVQKVVIPYSYSISFMVDLAGSEVAVKGNTIEVNLPAPKATYSKLTVDEPNMKKTDWLYRLTPERYAGIKEEIEKKLYDECSVKQEYLDAAWTTAVKNMESLFHSVAEKSEEGITCDINVMMQKDEPVATPLVTSQVGFSSGMEAPAPSLSPSTN